VIVNQQKFTSMCEGEKWRLLEVPFVVPGEGIGRGKEREGGSGNNVEVEVVWWAKVGTAQVASVDEFYLIANQ
jgi:hypothetical protein